MKKLLSTNHSSNKADVAILMVRLAVAAMMLTHGIPKLSSLLSGEVQFPPVVGLSPATSLLLTVLAEVGCSVLILVGLGTRLASIPLIITMLVALLLIHAADPFAKQELALFYLVTYTALFISGSGKFSIDHLLQPKTEKEPIAFKQVNIEDPTQGMYI